MGLERIAAAAGVIFATTADDSFWLIPFLSPTRYSPATRALHALAFCLSLQAVVLASSATSSAFGAGFRGQDSVLEISHGLLLQIVAATLAWIIAACLFIKQWRKRCRKRNANVGKPAAQGPDHSSTPATASRIGNDTQPHDVPAAGQEPSAAAAEEPASVKMVFVLGLLGGLDELAYFPTLLLGGTFTAFELSCGAVLATVGIVVVLIVALERFRPVLEFFDRIPLWGVVASFASIMTAEILIELNEGAEHPQRLGSS